MFVEAVVEPRSTLDWVTVRLVAYIDNYTEDPVFGYSIEYDVTKVRVEHSDGSISDDLTIEDLQDLMNGFDYDVLEAMLVAEYLSGVEYDFDEDE